MKRYLLIVPLLLSFIAASCSPAAPSVDQPGATATGQLVQAIDPNQPTLSESSRELLPNYSATFQIMFTGASQWKYLLTTRKSATLKEYTLHIEGATGAQNPGDVRMVTDGKTTWMIGAGTDQECVMYPNGMGMDPTLIYPESLESVQELLKPLTLDREGTLLGTHALHFMGLGISAGTWQGAQVDLYQDKATGALLRFAVQGTAEDKMFEGGTGKFDVRYTVDSLDAPTIEPVQGCEVAVPLPDSAVNVVRLPGMASFESPSSISDLTSFYQSKMPENGWTEKEPPSQNEGATILSYQKNTEEAEIHIEIAKGEGSLVKILMIKAQ